MKDLLELWYDMGVCHPHDMHCHIGTKGKGVRFPFLDEVRVASHRTQISDL